MSITEDKLKEINVLIERYFIADKFYCVNYTDFGISLQGNFDKELYNEFIDDGFNANISLDTGYSHVKLTKNTVSIVFDVKGTLEEILELKKEMEWD